MHIRACTRADRVGLGGSSQGVWTAIVDRGALRRRDCPVGRWLKGRDRCVCEASRRDIETYVGHLRRERSLGGRSIATRLSALRGLYRWLVAEGLNVAPVVTYAAARIALSMGTHGRSGSGSRAVRSDKRVFLRVAGRAGEHGREKRQMSQCRSQRRPEHDQRRLPE